MEDLITNSDEKDIMWRSGTNETDLDSLMPANQEDVAGLQREIEKEIIPPKVVDEKGYFEWEWPLILHIDFLILSGNLFNDKNFERFKANVSDNSQCFALEHSVFKTKHLKVY